MEPNQANKVNLAKIIDKETDDNVEVNYDETPDLIQEYKDIVNEIEQEKLLKTNHLEPIIENVTLDNPIGDRLFENKKGNAEKKNLKPMKDIPNVKQAPKKTPCKLPSLNSKTLDPDSLYEVLHASIEKKGLVGHHIESYNRFNTKGLKQIITQLFKIEGDIQNERTNTPEDNEIESIHYSGKFTDARLHSPIIKLNSGREEPLMPIQARQNRLNYSGSLYVDMELTATAYLKNSNETRTKPVEKVENFRITNMPIEIGSEYCNLGVLKESTKGIRKLNKEDPQEPGGYFILEGMEWVIDSVETRIFNHPYIFRNVGHEKEITRLEFISKPGDEFENSSETIMRYVQNKNIYITFTSQEFLKNVDIPFEIVFRLLGMTIDKEIVDNIVYGYGDVISDHMSSVICDAMLARDNVFGPIKNETNVGKILGYFAAKISKIHQIKAGISSTLEEDKKSTTYIITNILKWMDKYLFPHIGLGSDSRHTKLRFLGHLIHQLLLVEFQIVDSTNRDSLDGKRINPAGRSFAKSFKRDFNTVVIQPIKKHLVSDFNKSPFREVQMAHSVRSAISPSDLENALNQSIKSGSKEITIKNRQLPNRMPSEMLIRKNQSNYLSTMRVGRTASSSASKQDQRADEMRRVDPSYQNNIDGNQSADTGETVGMAKQFAISAIICESGSSQLLKNILLADPMVIHLDKMFPANIYKYNITNVLVNGDWIGGCTQPAILVARYREFKRGNVLHDFDHAEEKHVFGIDKYTTVYWKTDINEIDFRIDAGRIMHPSLIVRNNGPLDPIGRKHFESLGFPKMDPITGEGFVQDILITNKDIEDLIAKRIDVDDLQKRGLIEYVSAEELKNYRTCPSVEYLSCNIIAQYTHCDVPQALVGLVALAAPFAQHLQLPRLTIWTNQGKQTNGIPCLNHPYRYDKNLHTQFHIESPIVRTVANRYLYPNGLNCMMAMLSYMGYNQEDSKIFNMSAMQREMFTTLNSSFIQTKEDKDEHIGNPDKEYTINLKMKANYDQFKKGLPPKGMILENNDVVIAKYADIPDSSEKRDISVTYPNLEKSRVSNNPQILHNQNGERFAIVKYSSVRRVNVGTKFSTRSGQKGETSIGLNQTDMPFNQYGQLPSMVDNPHGLPSRMTVSQEQEGQLAKKSIIYGELADATIFRHIDTERIGDALEAMGEDRYGYDKMFNGRTGEWIDEDVSFTPIYYQRLQKFVEEDLYAISTGPTCAITRQPLEGKANKGGLRIGEMEKDVLLSHGASVFLMEKFRDDSDGFDIYICRTCGKMPTAVNEIKEIYKCKNCQKLGLNPDIVKVRSTWTSKLFFQELESMNVGLHFGVTPFGYEEQL
jgi:DNA-directed RNA polymerase II subunit RPB2